MTDDATSPADKLLLLDSASLYFRAFYGVPDSVTGPDGTPVNAVRGFLDMVATLVTQLRPTRLVACWDDDWRPAFRVAAIPSYKAHRLARTDANGVDVEETPEKLVAQVPVIVDVLAALGVARVGHAGFEADDVIGTLTERAASAGTPVDVVTGDRDLFQLVDDARAVRVLYTAKGGVRNLDVVDEARLHERYGIRTGNQYAGMAVLRGDPSDGLPGVAGIGEKTAAAIMNRAGDVQGLLRALEDDDADVLGNKRLKLLEARDYLAVAPTVVDVVRDIPLADVDDRLPSAPADPERLLDLAQRWGLSSSVERVLQAIGWTGD
ncbi:MAG: 5'-3' exonuclease [Angustibacter sp.]